VTQKNQRHKQTQLRFPKRLGKLAGGSYRSPRFFGKPFGAIPAKWKSEAPVEHGFSNEIFNRRRAAAPNNYLKSWLSINK